MIYLDTHIVVWLYQKDENRFSTRGREIINENDLLISPMVELELEYLFEIERLNVRSDEILSYLENRIGMKKCTIPFSDVIWEAKKYTWTRDLFDRIITAQAGIHNSPLLTKDKTILRNYSKAIW